MLCQECQQRPASVHVTKVINGQKSETHLCEVCARDKGQFELVPTFPIVGFSIPNLLANLLNKEQMQTPRGALHPGDVRCPACGTSYAQFAESGRLGCSQCWDALAIPLTELVRRIHGTLQHTGKLPKRVGGTVRLKKELGMLKQELMQTVQREEFEEAARLRDRIREVERRIAEGGDPGAVE